MKEKYLELIAKQLKCEQWRVANVVSMLEDGNTVPFISRYRKEKTGGLDDAQIVEIQRCMEKFEALEKRKATVRKTIQEQGCLTEELSAKIEECSEASLLEDIYLPYRPKRRTRASVAREAGLGPLAEGMFSCKIQYPLQEASRYMNEKVPTEELVLAGARDIIAEMLNESAYVRGEVRGFLSHRNLVSSATKAAKDNPDALNYRAYFKHNEGINRIPAHRMLAMLRGEREGFLTLKMDLNADRLQEKIYFRVFHKKHPGYVLSVQLRQAVRDALDRLIIPSVTNDLVAKAKDKADLDSIKVFGDNLRQLLLAAPLGPKRVMAVDPGFRNGCKIACIDENGGLLHYETIYPHPPQNEKVKSIVAVSKMMNEYGVEAIGIGNGTASRETKDFFSRIPMPDNCHIYLVSEDGASVYSASEVGREEFPDEDATVRGAVSIGRRLQDPLAELVKIDPKSLGVGQYQHDVDQKLLRHELDRVVEQCVSSVGVNLNTASTYLLSYIAGIGPSLAGSIVEYRSRNGGFRSREELLKVPRLGPKVFKQCSGFLRVIGADNPLDATAIHPEAYALVESMAREVGRTVGQLVGNPMSETLLGGVAEKFVCDEFGPATIKDIIKEVARPARDPREAVQEFAFCDEIHDIEDLEVGMVVPGIVTNITDFGAFVNIGVHKEGLISSYRNRQNAGRSVNPVKALKIGQHIYVKVTSVDLERRRIGLLLEE